MKKRNFNSIITKTYIVLGLLLAFSSGCKKDFFDKQPLDAVSDATFWKTDGDAQLALVGCYNNGNAGWRSEDFWTPRAILYLDLMAGDGSEKELIPDHVTDGLIHTKKLQPVIIFSIMYQISLWMKQKRP